MGLYSTHIPQKYIHIEIQYVDVTRKNYEDVQWGVYSPAN